ncbi:TIGR03617 family F420-dependent LLM class oxidoreductase [Gordonia sp. HY002]|uniref:TIGR03617 family F420-dependent LLM class oxidoreductase n=1 Tax=Gordonia zhenghanii TaxID=2911516 RepID=UPI001EF02AFB|nr:TIGR03617 family F420-dependent LLM class oxidoreductase [Gordonia zhenghanii]MCF8570138.1 TIGR03617 family F420-dependent LLM class oxidoreductase [Gordonia zhenghanii]MCF8605395.1 TIGR03617 family F420-dependent LLM class oxidoreductase [Gordonia zhenghanii]
MLVDTTLTCPLDEMPARAAAAEESGYDGVWTFEGAHDPFLPLLLAAEHTETLTLGTSIAVAFGRNPLLLATMGWDLQAYSRGRFVLGLGTQIRPHIERRYSMPWSRPADRMRDLVTAVRAIWDSWLTGGRLDHRGEFYTQTLMPPLFRPEAGDVDGFGPPPVWLAGVGPRMTRVAGEVADGFLSHPLATPEFLRDTTLVALDDGAAGRPRPAVHHSAMVIVGRDDTERSAARAAVRAQIGFYGSTPAYRRVLDSVGFGDLQPQLRELTRDGDWQAIARLVPDDLVDAVAVTVDDPAEGAAEILRRYGPSVDRLGFNTPYRADPDLLAGLAREVRRIDG